MTNPIEVTAKQQQKCWRGFLIAFFLTVALLAVRALFYYAFGEYDLNAQPIGTVVLIATIIALIIQVFFLVKLGRLKSKVGADPQLREAILEDELSRLYALQSWKPAFMGAIATPFGFLLISSFYPFCDLLTVSFTTIIVGSATYLTSYYVKSRA